MQMCLDSNNNEWKIAVHKYLFSIFIVSKLYDLPSEQQHVSSSPKKSRAGWRTRL